ALKETRAKARFERGDRARNGLGRDAQFARCGREAALVGDCDEGRERVEPVHDYAVQWNKDFRRALLITPDAWGQLREAKLPMRDSPREPRQDSVGPEVAGASSRPSPRGPGHSTERVMS